MKKKLCIILIFIFTSGCQNSDLSKIRWAPSDENHSGELRTILLLQGDLGKIGECSVLAKITDEDKVFRIDDALNDTRYFCHSYDTLTPESDQKAICFVDTNDNGYMIRIDLDNKEKKVTFSGGYSENLYKVLNKYGIIASANNLDVIPFSSDPDLAKISFVPMPEYAGCNGNLEKVVFLEGDHHDFIFKRTENLSTLAEITDPTEIKKIKLAFSSGEFCTFHLLESASEETAIGFIYKDGRGELFRIDPNPTDQTVEFQGGYSKELYDILVWHGIIKAPE
jgi:hypothetical protein